jgi:hypothetical protein
VEVRESVADLVRQQGAQGVPLQPMRALPSAGQGPDASSAERGSAPADPIEAAPAEFRVLAEGALRRLNDLPALSQHPLLDVLVPASAATTGVAVAVGASSPTGISDEVTAEPTALERAKGLRDTLVAAIARLRPPGARPLPGAHGGSGGWLHFLVLHEAYVEGRPNKEIMQRYSLSEGTFHRARRRAIDVLALDLYQRGQG